MRGNPPIRTWCVSIPPWKIIMFSHVFPMKMIILIHFGGYASDQPTNGDYFSTNFLPGHSGHSGHSWLQLWPYPEQTQALPGSMHRIFSDGYQNIGWSLHDHWMIIVWSLDDWDYFESVLWKACKKKWWTDFLRTGVHGFLRSFSCVATWERVEVPDQVTAWELFEELSLSLFLSVFMHVFIYVHYRYNT